MKNKNFIQVKFDTKQFEKALSKSVKVNSVTLKTNGELTPAQIKIAQQKLVSNFQKELKKNFKK